MFDFKKKCLDEETFRKLLKVLLILINISMIGFMEIVDLKNILH